MDLGLQGVNVPSVPDPLRDAAERRCARGPAGADPRPRGAAAAVARRSGRGNKTDRRPAGPGGRAGVARSSAGRGGGREVDRRPPSARRREPAEGGAAGGGRGPRAVRRPARGVGRARGIPEHADRPADERGVAPCRPGRVVAGSSGCGRSRPRHTQPRPARRRPAAAAPSRPALRRGGGEVLGLRPPGQRRREGRFDRSRPAGPGRNPGGRRRPRPAGLREHLRQVPRCSRRGWRGSART